MGRLYEGNWPLRNPVVPRIYPRIYPKVRSRLTLPDAAVTSH